MKKVLLKSAVILHPESAFHNQKADVLITEGKIAAIGNTDIAAEDALIIDAEGKFLSPGFFDLNANFGEPGYETREDLESGSAAAVAGGFTGVAVHPNTNPPIHSKAQVSYIVNQTKGGIVEVRPFGSISYNREGKDLAELYDMHKAGALAFTDGTRPIADSGLMSRALLYAKGFGGRIVSFPEDTCIAGKGMMNEGEVSTYLGMKGIPALAEELLISRDLYLAEYNDAPVHFATISTAQGVDLVRKAKQKGLKVTCDVAAHHLVLSEKALEGFDSNYKVKPPLRTDDDVQALKEGLLDGTIDAIVSQHNPQEIEYKNVEFEIASFGIIALQTVLPLALRAGLSAEVIVEKLAINPRKILGIEVPTLSEGKEANLVLFDAEKFWTFNSATNKSKSNNSPFFNTELKGRVEFICNNGKFLTCKYG